MRPGRHRQAVEAVARLHLKRIRDPELRRQLTPPDSALCKRPVVSTGFYTAIQRPDVDLVTTGITRIEPEGVRTADGVLHALDVLILATGFQAHQYMRPIDVVGEDGATLDQVWDRGPYGYRTMSLPGFPNMFMILGPHSPLLSFPLHTSAELQSEYSAQLLELLKNDDVVSVAPTQAATDGWLGYLKSGMDGTIWLSGCNSWYLGDADVPVLWPYGRVAWREALATPRLEDYVIQRRAPVAV